MMDKPNSIQELLGGTDIYLIDQIMKGRYAIKDKILDAGCGNGRNLPWFLQNDIDISGIDISREAISVLKNKYSFFPGDRFQVSPVDKIPFPDHHFNHVISSAVLHFANSTSQFQNMLAEMIRVLKRGGSLFVRMTSNIGIEDKVKPLGDGIYIIPDGSKRFLLTKSLLINCMQRFDLIFIEPLKTVNVDDIRCMSTLVLQKK